MIMYPWFATLDFDCCAYAARRSGSGDLAVVDVSSTLRNAFGNWKDSVRTGAEGPTKRTKMSDRYTEDTLAVSFTAKYLVNEGFRQTVEKTNSVNFVWEDINLSKDKVENIASQGRELGRDISLLSG